LISSFILGAIVYFISSFKMQLISKIWVNNFKYVLYFSIFSFGFLHYKNFNISSINFFFLPVIVLPQFISAIIYSYIRVNYNFWYAVAFHCLNNIIIIII
jgi:hypothetical protein